ncbi:MAG: endonuclease III [Acidimicrobiales bacterium]
MGRPRTPAGRARESARRLAAEYPGSPRELCELVHRTPYELLTATILSAQTTDKGVNLVTPALFARYPTPEALAAADLGDVETIIASTGFFRAKSRSITGMAEALIERFDGDVPHRMEDLVTLPGVGRKTANVVRSVALGEPGFPVDTHVLRLVRRLAITDETDPVRVERVVDTMVSPTERGLLSLRLIRHGRRVCVARRPRCDVCVLADFCPAVGTG